MRKNNKFYSRLKRGAPTIFTVLGIAGVVATGILSARAANKTRNELQMTDFDEPEEWSVSKNFRYGWENYIPPIAVGVVTIICIASSDILNKRAQMSLTSAYALLHTSYNDYQRKNKELYGEEAHRKIIDSLAAEKAEDVYMSTTGIVSSSCLAFNDRADEETKLFYDSYAKRYFESTLSQVLEAEYHLNRDFTMGGDAVINNFYGLLGIEPIKDGDIIGWFLSDELRWIDFDHHKTVLDDGLEVYIIDFVFTPRLGIEGEDY